MFYERFRYVCQRLGVSMSSVLDAAHLSRGNLNRWKSGITPKLETQKLIAAVLEIPASLLQGIPPFEDLKFLDEYKNIILATSQEISSVPKTENKRILNDFSDREYWKIIDSNFADIKHGKSKNTLEFLYKTNINPQYDDPSKTITNDAILPIDVKLLLENYYKLNNQGKNEARNRMQELTEIPRYCKNQKSTPDLDS